MDLQLKCQWATVTLKARTVSATKSGMDMTGDDAASTKLVQKLYQPSGCLLRYLDLGDGSLDNTIPLL
jgi:hypothetical protein